MMYKKIATILSECAKSLLLKDGIYRKINKFCSRMSALRKELIICWLKNRKVTNQRILECVGILICSRNGLRLTRRRPRIKIKFINFTTKMRLLLKRQQKQPHQPLRKTNANKENEGQQILKTNKMKNKAANLIY